MKKINQIGITEGGDASLDLNWIPWVNGGNLIILISKDPSKLVQILKEKIDPTFYKNIILHCTITGLGGSQFEPNVPSYLGNLNNYKQIKSSFLEHPLAKLVLRVDPIIPIETTLSKQLEVISDLGKKEYFDELKISFIDNFPHIRNKIKLPWQGIHAPLEMRTSVFEKIKTLTNLKIKICGEPGFPCTGCVSIDDLISFNKNFKDFNIKKADIREGCGCIAAKKELLNNRHPCYHDCIYCYWKPFEQKD